jgi:hypothetical protein
LQIVNHFRLNRCGVFALAGVEMPGFDPWSLVKGWSI